MRGRELEPIEERILNGLADGLTPTQIQRAAGVSDSGYAKILHRARSKLGATTTWQVVGMWTLQKREQKAVNTELKRLLLNWAEGIADDCGE